MVTRRTCEAARHSTLQRLSAMTLTFFLSCCPLLARRAGASKALVLGTITQASGAHFNAASASAGGTVYDGDMLSTETDGALQFRGNSSMIYLAGSTSVILHRVANGTQALLRNGTAVVSARRATDMEIVGDGAAIRPLADVPTIAQITISGPKELQIYARRAALQFSYRSESATLQEGSSYRILLDPQEPSTVPKSQSGPTPSGHKNKLFKIIIATAAAGLITSIAVRDVSGSPESPDHP